MFVYYIATLVHSTAIRWSCDADSCAVPRAPSQPHGEGVSTTRCLVSSQLWWCQDERLAEGKAVLRLDACCHRADGDTADEHAPLIKSPNAFLDSSDEVRVINYYYIHTWKMCI